MAGIKLNWRISTFMCFGQVHLDCIFLKGCTQKASTWVSRRDHQCFRFIQCWKAIQRGPISSCAPTETLMHHGFTWMRHLGSFQWTKPWSGATSVVYVSLTYNFICLNASRYSFVCIIHLTFIQTFYFWVWTIILLLNILLI